MYSGFHLPEKGWRFLLWVHHSFLKPRKGDERSLDSFQHALLLLLPSPPHIAERSWNRARQVAANVCCLKSLSNRRVLLSSTCGAMVWLYSQEEGAVAGDKSPLPTGLVYCDRSVKDNLETQPKYVHLKKYPTKPGDVNALKQFIGFRKRRKGHWNKILFHCKSLFAANGTYFQWKKKLVTQCPLSLQTWGSCISLQSGCCALQARSGPLRLRMDTLKVEKPHLAVPVMPPVLCPFFRECNDFWGTTWASCTATIIC